MWNPDGTLNDADAGEVPMVPAVATPGFPPTWPTDDRAGGVPNPAARGPKMIQIGDEGGFLPAPVVLPNQPIDYKAASPDGTANMGARTLLLGPAERADVIVDFSQVPPGSKLILYNDAPAPAPTQDPRYDYYTGDPDQTLTGGAPRTLAGYGPNTRTLMQFDVQGSPAPAFGLGTLQARLPVAYGATQPKPIVPEQAYDAAFGTTTADNTYSGLLDTSLNWAGLLHPLTMYPKSINEGFENGFGRLDAVLGTELNGDSLVNRTGVPLAYVDPPTEIIKPSVAGTEVGSLNDGTQIWKITHNGVDSHAIHFHLFDVQLINRVGVDGVITPPEPNELGWKETVMMNPQEDAIVALRPTVPKLPFKVPDSIRLLDPDRPESTANHLYDFGWEYVWHCHLLGHEENDMMRPMVFQVSPTAPTNLTATVAGAPAKVKLYWTNNATYPAAHNMLVQRADDADFTTGVKNTSVNGSAVSTTDSSVSGGATYYYRIRAETTAAYSAWSNVLTVTALTKPAIPTGLTLTTHATGAGAASIGAAWTASAGPTVTGYQIQRATNSSYTTGFASYTIPASPTSYTLGGLARNTRYYVRVRTLNGSAVSLYAAANIYTPR
jgi:hypothetical protein